MDKLEELLIEKEISKSEDKDLIVYGLCTGIEVCFNIITTIVLGFLFEMVIESLVFFLSFSLIRTNAGGYHCQKAINCYLLSSGIVTLVLAMVRFTPKEFTHIVGVIILIISILILIRLAPVGTLTKPLEIGRASCRERV